MGLPSHHCHRQNQRARELERCVEGVRSCATGGKPVAARVCDTCRTHPVGVMRVLSLCSTARPTGRASGRELELRRSPNRRPLVG
jgi:hypothetical protein